ncbi:hypothetical protein [Pseudomonas sp. M47T1]|uniref:hypothetical protein n=1 Tax=Pseudomonas sp. M47T1 TaxID=1179778 RepID=UPI00031D5599|nr:hypothetical protein [Pseudomonas sp. M47T1]
MAKLSKVKIKNDKVILADGSIVDMHPRHNFDKPTRLLLQHMAAGVCSNPDCLSHTIGSNLKRNDYAGNGVAAHICAAAPGPGAARYNKHQTKEERSSYKNGIWLCGSCSIIIDRDESRYPVDLLCEWKAKAEKRAMTMVGTKSLTQFELADSIRAEVVRALTCNFNNMVNPFEFPVQSIHHSYSEAIEKLDPRFSVKTVVDGAITHVLSAKNISDSRFSVVATGEAASELQDKIENHRLTGQGFKIDSSKINFINNDIFQAFKQSRPGSYLYLKPAVLKVQSSLYLVSANSRHFLCTFESSYVGGEKVITVDGETLDGFLSFCFKVNAIDSNVFIEFKTSIESWFGNLVSGLKHLPKYLEASRYLDSVAEFGFLIEYENSDTLVQIPPAKAECYIQNNESTISFKKCLSALCALHGFSKILSDNLYIKHSPLDTDSVLLSQSFLQLEKGAVLQPLEYGSLIFSQRMDSIDPELASYFCSGVEGVYFSISDGVRVLIEVFGNFIECPPVVASYEGFEVALYYGICGEDSGFLFVNLYSNQETKVTFSLGDGGFVLRG